MTTFYADPTKCPACRADLSQGARECGSCLYQLTAEATVTIWRALQEVDRQVAIGREQSQRIVAARQTVPASMEAPSPPPQVAQPPASADLPSYPAPAAVHPPRKSVSAGTVLLMLGALFFLGAGSALSLLTLGFFALPLMAVLLGGMAVLTHHKSMRSTTETFITLSGLTLGLFLGLFLWDSPGGVALWAFLGLVAWTALSAILLSHRFLMPGVLSALSMIFTVGATISWIFLETDSILGSFLAITTVAAVSGLVLAGAYRMLDSVPWPKPPRYPWMLAAAGPLLGLVTAYGVAAVGFLLDPTVAALETGDPYPFLMLALLHLGLSFVRGLPEGLRFGLLTTAVLQLFFFIYLPLLDESKRLSVAFALVVALGLLAHRSTHWRFRALAYSSIVPAAIGLGSYLTALALRWDAVGEGLWVADSSPLKAVLPLHGDWLTVLSAGLALAAYMSIWLRRSELKYLRSGALEISLTAFLLQVPAVLLFLYPSPFYGALAVAGLAVVATVSLRGRFPVVSALALCTAPLLVAVHPLLLALFLALSGVHLLLYMVLRRPSSELQQIMVPATVAFGLGSYFALLWEWEPELRLTALSVLLGGVAVVCLAWALRRLTRIDSLSVEAIGGLTLLGALTLALSTPPSWCALLFLMAGVALIAVRLLDGTAHSVYGWSGAASVGVSWIARLIASDVTTPEAYTLPFATALAIFGAYRFYRLGKENSWASFTPSLTLTFLGSAPWILSDPWSLRAYLLTGVAILLLTVALNQKLQAVFVVTSLFLAAMALIWLGPFVVAINGWILLLGFGSILLFLGATVERRIQDGRALIAYVETMR